MRGLVVGYGYKEWGNMGCFGNLIVVSGSVIYNVLVMSSIIDSFPIGVSTDSCPLHGP